MPDAVPVLDVSRLVAGRADAAAVRAIGAACSAWGLFQITGHGIAPARRQRFLAEARRFFALPTAAKRSVERSAANARGYYDRELTKQVRDWKEIFDFGREPEPALPDASDRLDGASRWPAGLPDFKEVMTGHFAACETVALRMLEAVCLSLGLPGDRLHSEFVGCHSSFLRLNHYPRCPDAAPAGAPSDPASGHLGINRHTDAGALTVLLQDDVAGLQVHREGRWTTVESVADALVVNLGDMLQVWSNDRYTAPLHRVLASAAGERFSAAFFLNPSYATVCTPLAAATGPARYRPVPWAEFRARRAQGDYADLGREVQIAQYRAP